MNPDPTPDPTLFSSDFKGWKKSYFSSYFFHITSGTLSSVLKIKFFAKILC